jgi:hypothetical protein
LPLVAMKRVIPSSSARTIIAWRRWFAALAEAIPIMFWKS